MKRKKATQLVVGVIAPYFKHEIAKDLQSNMFSIIIDETTDISTKKLLILLVRYWKNGLIQDRVFDLIEVRDASAQGMFNSLKHVLDFYQIPYTNLLGIAADNASTMMGHLNGVQAKLRVIAPHIHVQRCASHSLHLCSSAAAKKLPNNVEQFTRDIYAYFSHSSKRQEELEECQVFAKENPAKMLYPSQTRWLSLRAVVNRILDHWNSLIIFFTRAALEDNLPTAKSILGALKNDIYKMYLLFFSYVLELVTKVNLEFQSEQPKLPIFLERMTTLYRIILKGFTKKHILETVPLSNINVCHPKNYLEIYKMFFGAKVDTILKAETIDKGDVHNFRLKAMEFYIELAKQIKERFNFEDEILKYASYFTPQRTLSGEILSIAQFVNLFPNVTIDIEAANTEWLLISDIANNSIDLASDLDNICKFWGKIENIKNSLNENMFPNLMKLVKIILSLPNSSAAAERAFSGLTLAKTKLRNRLLISTCSAILITKDNLRKIENGSLGWRPPLSIINYNSHAIEKINIEEE
ncbi:unnamed protein product [Psylliodes chrysocephalus]|uniref:HAT C-terminal dimerisation domain-containing protein n=1 Tax=Psylliodes chrysocephalus TaxID=3402493 RepID=A0A9P0GG82_9CUCU|nr:unnamed protein product [Psylliodes chrysocephala]